MWSEISVLLAQHVYSCFDCRLLHLHHIRFQTIWRRLHLPKLIKRGRGEFTWFFINCLLFAWDGEIIYLVEVGGGTSVLVTRDYKKYYTWWGRALFYCCRVVQPKRFNEDGKYVHDNVRNNLSRDKMLKFKLKHNQSRSKSLLISPISSLQYNSGIILLQKASLVECSRYSCSIGQISIWTIPKNVDQFLKILEHIAPDQLHLFIFWK